MGGKIKKAAQSRFFTFFALFFIDFSVGFCYTIREFKKNKVKGFYYGER